jgi:predicted Zn-dependent protease
MIALKLLSTDNEIKMRPKRVTNTKNYTRMHKIIINNLNAHLYETAKIDAQVYNSIEYVKKYFVNAYGLEKWDQEQDARLTLKQETNDHVDKEQQEKIDRSTGKYYTDHYQHFASDVARRAAEAFKNIEEQIKKYKQRREDEQNE